MYLINFTQLQIGDIIFSIGDGGFESTLVELFQLYKYTHVRLYEGMGRAIEATKEGVFSNNLLTLAIKDESDVLVLRSKFPLFHLYRVVDIASSYIGTGYSKLEALKSALHVTSHRNTNRQICSKLVAESYSRAGIPLVDNHFLCIPLDLRASDKLYKVDIQFTHVTEDHYLDLMSGTEHEVEVKQKYSQWLKDVRDVTKHDIQNTVQLLEYLNENKHYDGVFYQLGKPYFEALAFDIQDSINITLEELFTRVPKENVLRGVDIITKAVLDRLALIDNQLQIVDIVGQPNLKVHRKLINNLSEQKNAFLKIISSIESFQSSKNLLPP